MYNHAGTEYLPTPCRPPHGAPPRPSRRRHGRPAVSRQPSISVATGTLVALLAFTVPQLGNAASAAQVASRTGSLRAGSTVSAMVTSHGLGLLASPVHQSPRVSAAIKAHTVVLPATVNLTGSMPPAGNQGSLNSCVSWAVGYTLYGYYVRAEHLSGGDHAPMYLYSQVKLPGGGSYFVGYAGVAGNLDTARSQGVDTESDYPQGYYDDSDLPTPAERAHASRYEIDSYQTLFDGAGQADASTVIEEALAGGQPVLLGIPVYSPGFDETTYDYPGPTSSDYFRGDHAVVAVGYDNYGIVVENSWGDTWGDNGFADLSYGFIDTYAFAAYAISAIGAPAVPTVSSISSSAGPTTGGTSVTIIGTGFTGVSAVNFGSTAAPSYSVNSPTSISVVSPAGLGTVDITVTTAAGTTETVTGDRFTYLPSYLIPPRRLIVTR